MTSPPRLKAAPTPPKPPAPPSEQIEQQSNVVDAEVEEQDFNGDIVTEDGEIIGDTEFFEQLEASMALQKDEESIEEVWTEFDALSRFEGDETNQSIALAIKKRALKRIGG